MTVHDSLSGGFAVPPLDSARAFRAAMEAMARPGTIREVDGAQPPAPLSPAAGALILALCDPSTPLHLAGPCDTPAVRAWIAFHSGAPIVAAQEASFAVGPWASLIPLDRFPLGAPDYPDRSATLIVEVPHLAPGGTRLTGPGIRDEARLSLPDPVDPLRHNAARFPLGLDLFLTCGSRLAAVPRSTRIG